MFIFLLLLLTFSIQAVTFSKIMIGVEGTAVQSFEIERGKGQFQRKSNYFGPETDYRLGKFTTTENLSQSEKRIKQLIANMKGPEGKMKDIGHWEFFQVDDYIVDPYSNLHKDLQKEFEKLQKVQWKFIEGEEISPDLTVVKDYEGGKVKETRAFPVNYHCGGRDQRPVVCKIMNIGVLFIR